MIIEMLREGVRGDIGKLPLAAQSIRLGRP